MPERKNLKIAPDTFEDLKDEKRDMETWDSMLRRLLPNRDDICGSRDTSHGRPCQNAPGSCPHHDND